MERNRESSKNLWMMPHLMLLGLEQLRQEKPSDRLSLITDGFSKRRTRRMGSLALSGLRS
jgi:hypothetical protein